MWSFVIGVALLVSGSAFASDLALVHARIYTSPTAAPIVDGTIAIHDGRIRAVGQGISTNGSTVLDCKGLTVTAGLWNSHVHIFTAGLLDAARTPAGELTAQMETMFTKWGFTTVFDLGSLLANTNALRKRIAGGEVAGPRILTVGEPFFVKGGIPVYIQGFVEAHHVKLPEFQSNAESAGRVRQLVRDGADGIKIFAGSIESNDILVMPLDNAKAIVTEAHRLGRPVFAHPSNRPGVEVALESGVDVLAHVAIIGGPWPPSLVERLRAAHMGLIPTLTLFDSEAKKAGVTAEENQRWLDVAVGQLRAYFSAGGQILFGTDAGYIDQYDTTEEYELMSRAGMTFPQILASLTTNPCERFRSSSHSGRIAAGMDADVTVLDGDPSVDIKALSKVRCTIRDGKIVYQAHV